MTLSRPYTGAVQSVRRMVGLKEQTRDSVYSFLLPRVLYTGVPPSSSSGGGSSSCSITSLSQMALTTELARAHLFGTETEEDEGGEGGVSSVNSVSDTTLSSQLSAIARRLIDRQARAIEEHESLSAQCWPSAKRRDLERKRGAPLPVNTRTLSRVNRHIDHHGDGSYGGGDSRGSAHRRASASVPPAGSPHHELRLEQPRPDAPPPALYSAAAEGGGKPQAELVHAAASSGEAFGTSVLDLPTGFGKTRIAVATLREWAAAASEAAGAVIVVICPKPTLNDWRRILKEHGPPGARFVVLSLEKLRGGGGGGGGGNGVVNDDDKEEEAAAAELDRNDSGGNNDNNKRKRVARATGARRVVARRPSSSQEQEDTAEAAADDDNDGRGDDLDQWGELANCILTRSHGGGGAAGLPPSYRPHPVFLQTIREQGDGNLWIVVDEAHTLATSAKTRATRKYAAVQALANVNSSSSGDAPVSSVRTLLLSGSLLPSASSSSSSSRGGRRPAGRKAKAAELELEATAGTMLDITGNRARLTERGETDLERLESICCTRRAAPAVRDMMHAYRDRGGANVYGRRRHDYKATYADDRSNDGSGPVETAARLGRALLQGSGGERRGAVKLLIFYRMIEGQEAIRDRLNADLALSEPEQEGGGGGRRRCCALVNSQTSDADTHAAFEAFRAPDSGCDALVIGFGNAQGVNLDVLSPAQTGVCVVFNAHEEAVRRQSAGRVMRMNTPSDAYVYYLFGKHDKEQACGDGAPCPEDGFVDIVTGRRTEEQVLRAFEAACAASEEAAKQKQMLQAKQAMDSYMAAAQAVRRAAAEASAARA